MPHLPLDPTSRCTCWCPPAPSAPPWRRSRPRVRAHRVDPADGPPDRRGRAGPGLGAAHGRRGAPDNGFLEALPRLRLVQLLSAGAERFVGRLPEGVAALQRPRRAHAVDGGVGGGGDPRRAARASRSSSASRRPGAGRSRRTRSLVGARVLVVGAGDIGRTIGRMLAGFDVELTYVARTARDGVRSTADLPELLPHADVVILIVPVTPETTGMVDAAFLAAMPDGALLVNAARGVVVDTDALVAELTAGRLRAALDVTDPEPLPAGPPALVGARPAAHPARRRCGPGDQRPGRRGGHRPAGPGPGRRAAGRTSSTATDLGGRLRHVDPAAGEVGQPRQVAGRAAPASAPRCRSVVTSHRSPRAATRMPASSVPRHPPLAEPASARSVRRRRCRPRPAAPRP